MITEIVRDFKSIVADYEARVDNANIPHIVRARHEILAARCVKGIMSLLIGYDERSFKYKLSPEEVLMRLRNIRSDIYNLLENEGIDFSYIYKDGLIYAQLANTSELVMLYPLTSYRHANAIYDVIDSFEVTRCTVH
ncbi:hypothetical protein D3C85_14070 [compost metagenome]